MMRTLRHSSGFFVASILLHTAALASVYTYFTASFDSDPVTEVAPRISLGVAASQAGSIAEPETETTEAKTEPSKPKPVVEKTTDAPAPRQTPVTKEPPPVPETNPQQEENTEPETQPSSPPAEPVTPGNQGIEGTNAAQVQQRETSHNSEAGAQQMEAQYDNMVLRLLKEEKRYPALAKRRRHEGTVRLTFTIDRAGQLASRPEPTVKSRWPELGKSVQDQLGRAAPFPAAPEGTRWDTRTYNVDVNFDLEEDRR